MKKVQLNDGLENNDLLPLDFYLSQNFPNPFDQKTLIKYCIPYRTYVKIIVSDPNGRKIETLVDEEKNAGTYEVEFDVVEDHPGKSSKPLEGSYFYVMETPDFTVKKEMKIYTPN